MIIRLIFWLRAGDRLCCACSKWFHDQIRRSHTARSALGVLSRLFGRARSRKEATLSAHHAKTDKGQGGSLVHMSDIGVRSGIRVRALGVINCRFERARAISASLPKADICLRRNIRRSWPRGDIRPLQRPEICVENVGTLCATLFDQITQNAQQAIQ